MYCEVFKSKAQDNAQLQNKSETCEIKRYISHFHPVISTVAGDTQAYCKQERKVEGKK